MTCGNYTWVSETCMAAKERGGRNLEPSRSSGAGQEAIRCREYEIFLERGQHPGGELDDWLRAEREFNKALVLEAFDTARTSSPAVKVFSTLLKASRRR